MSQHCVSMNKIKDIDSLTSVLHIISKAFNYDLFFKKLKEALAQSWSAQIQLAVYEIIE